MAKPIKNTPILKGQDAQLFYKQIASIPSKPERLRERQRIAGSVNKLVSLTMSKK